MKVPLTLAEVLDAPQRLDPQLPQVAWIPGTSSYYVIGARGDEEIVARQAAAGGVMRPLFGASALRDALAAAGARAGAEPAAGAADADADADRKKLPPFTFVDEDTVRVEIDDAVYHWEVGEPTARLRLRLIEGATATAPSPHDERGAFVVDHDVWVRKADGSKRRITWDGSADIVYGGAAHRAEFGITDGLWWDEAGRYLAWSREDQRPNAIYPYTDYQERPARPVHGRYPMAGQPHAKVTIGIWDSRDDSVRYLEHDPDLDLYWTNVTFHPTGAKVYVALVDRGQDHMDLVEFDTATGRRGEVLFGESDREWIEPQHGPMFLPDPNAGFLWFSPRDGYRHLYRYRPDGTLVGQVTRGAFDVEELVRFSPDGERCYVMASGDDPREMLLFAADTATGADLRRLTEPHGWHDCALADDGSVLDRYSSLDNPGTIDVLAPGLEPRQLFRAADPLAGKAVGEQRFFEVEADDGTRLYGQLILPPDFDPQTRYPVLHYVYGGPAVQLVRDAWPRGMRASWLRFMAGQGFVVSTLDNRGSDNRGIEFAQAIYRRMGTLEVDDQLKAVDWLKAKDWVDPARIGVHGWSYGGYMTLRLMLLAPDTFACGIAGAPVTDWARYETGYTERYMDTPQENPDGYAESACLGLASQLKGRLLLIQGTDDKTVMYSHAMAFLRASIDAGTLVEFMCYPMQQHGLRGNDQKHLFRLMTRFFDEHLHPSGR